MEKCSDREKFCQILSLFWPGQRIRRWTGRRKVKDRDTTACSIERGCCPWPIYISLERGERRSGGGETGGGKKRREKIFECGTIHSCFL